MLKQCQRNETGKLCIPVSKPAKEIISFVSLSASQFLIIVYNFLKLDSKAKNLFLMIIASEDPFFYLGIS